MKFEYEISEGTYHYVVPETEGLRQKRALCVDRRPLRRDTIASRDRFRPMGERQNLALYHY